MGKIDPLKRFKEHCEELNREALLALGIFEIYRPSANSKRIVSAFNETYEAWAFNAIRDSLHRDLTMTLSRIWDIGGDDVMSLPKAMMRLNGEETQRRIRKQAGATRIKRRANAKLMIDERGRTESEIQTLKEETRQFLNSKNADFRNDAERKAQLRIDKLIRAYGRVSAKPILKRLREHRNKRLAHIADPNSDAAASVEKLRWGDEAKILRLTLPLIEELCELVQECGHNYSDFGEVSRFHSRCFWERVRKKAKR